LFGLRQIHAQKIDSAAGIETFRLFRPENVQGGSGDIWGGSMESGAPPRWLEWAREIQALAQTGYHYDIPYEPVSGLFKAQTGYATPRVDVRGAVFRNAKLLLVRERSDGGWTLPGGWADVGDLPSRSAEREVREEAGFDVCARKVIGVYDANRIAPLELFHAFKIVFLCDLVGGSPTPSNETSEVAFFGLDEVPQVLSGERTQLRHIQDAFRAFNEPHAETVFD
jgi:ADP-ribose pyrophosphatase YjhB (NUDIX family)